MGTQGKEQDVGANPALQIVPHRPDIDVDGLERAISPLDIGKVLVSLYHPSRVELFLVHRGADDIDSIQGRLFGY